MKLKKSEASQWKKLELDPSEQKKAVVPAHKRELILFHAYKLVLVLNRYHLSSL